MSLALLWLEGSLQSWGADSRFGRRYTMPFPTRSGIMGLVCCALGLPGEQREWLALWKGYGQTVLAYSRKNKGEPNSQITSTNPLLRDFQMVGSGYDSSDSWQNMLIPKTSEGKKSVGGGSKLTYRYYIQDMAFACILAVPEGLDEKLRAGLEQPVWNICLGRKNCIPSMPVFQGLFPSGEDAFAASASLAENRGRAEIFRVLEGYYEDAVDTMIIRDIPVSFGLHKTYEDRQISLFRQLEE